jgi:eukaryotic-like serine/threonine-protein kinase
MKCPSCGRETPDRSADRCSTCNAWLPVSVSVAAGASPVSGADAETVFVHATPRAQAVSDIGHDTTGLPGSNSHRGNGALGPLEVGQRFGSRYHILRQLGIGGMGAVYQAYDQELEVAVALKVIRPEASRDVTAAQDIERRFKQELLLARQVTHKNVVRIHDLGEIDGIKYITMPYIKGADLARVMRDERLPVTKVMTLARQIAAGLQAAHDAGVVHRDLKPANVMIEGDQAVIMDFGIARSTSRVGVVAAGAEPATALRDIAIDGAVTRAAETIAGEVIGTIEYMAPEQARGERVDQRADIYAFGLILYDVLAGRRRSEHAVSAVGELQRRLAQPPPPLRSLVPDVPHALEQLVTRCTEPDAAKRFQTTAELVAALDRLGDTGKPRPIKRVVRLPLAVGVGSLLVMLSGFIWWYTRPPVQHDQVSVVIADFQNNTKDPAFDGTLEPMLKRALEGASFITAFDRDGIRRQVGAQLPERLDEAGARAIAVKQGLGVVLAGSISPEGSGYRVAVNATQAVTGEVIARNQSWASSKDGVLEVATRLMTRVRSALGDEASSSAQLFAMASLSATSLEVVGHWVAGRDAASRNNYEEAFNRYSKAVELDPKFGLGYAGLANVSANRSNQAEAEKYIKEALRHVTSMTERERYTTRGGFYRLTGDYRQCVKEYSELLASYPADVAAHNNLAICLANLREFSRAFDEVRKVVTILPNRALYRVNMASFANFSSDFRTAEQEARKVGDTDVNAMVALAFAQVGQGEAAQAAQTYESLRKISDYGASLGTSGLADLASLEGRYQDAVRTLEEGAARDMMFKRPDWAAAKFAALAHTELRRNQQRAAIAAAEKALINDMSLSVRFMTARAFVEAGAIDRARPLVKAMASEVLAEPQAYAKIVEGEIALKEGNARLAIDLLTQANGLLDTWLGHFDLGRAYLAAEQFAQADSEFERCLKRRGEALQLILGDEPTYAYLPPVYYYQGLVREGMKVEGAADSYLEYLKFRGNSTEDPHLPEIRKRATAVPPSGGSLRAP